MRLRRSSAYPYSVPQSTVWVYLMYGFGDTVVGFDHPMLMTYISNKTNAFGSVDFKKQFAILHLA